MVNFLATRDAGHSLMKSLRQSSAIQDVTVLPETKPAKKSKCILGVKPPRQVTFSDELIFRFSEKTHKRH